MLVNSIGGAEVHSILEAMGGSLTMELDEKKSAKFSLKVTGTNSGNPVSLRFRIVYLVSGMGEKEEIILVYLVLSIDLNGKSLLSL